MRILHRLVQPLPHYSRRRLVWRSALAAPFALSLLLAPILGPATVDSPHASFAWLVAWSLVTTLAILRLADGFLILVGLASLIAFPLLAGLGFHLAPTWSGPLVAAIFYGSIVSSLAAIATGLVAVIRPLVRARPRGAALGAGQLAALGVTAIVVAASAPGGVGEETGASAATVRTLGSVINTALREAEPTFSADGRTMIFNCRDYEICISRLKGSWESGEWSRPELMRSPISSDYFEIEPWLSPAGDKLYFNSTRPFADGGGLPGLALYVNVVGLIGGGLGIAPLGGVGQDEVWVSYLHGGRWSEPVNLNEAPGEPPVNSAHMDHCLAFTADGDEAFWTSTRPGGYGGNDIWTSRRVNGTWSTPENLGPNVNSPASEHHSLPTPDGRQLHVTSDRPGGLGGEDMYVAARAPDGTWDPPSNLGSPLNGPANDRCTAWTPDGSIFLFDSDRPEGFGSKDLWWLHLSDVAHAASGGG